MKKIYLVFIAAFLTSITAAQNFNVDVNWSSGYYPKDSTTNFYSRVLRDKDNNLFVIGNGHSYIYNTSTVYVAKLNSSGDIIWQKPLDYLSNGPVMTLDSADNFYFAYLDSSNLIRQYFVPRDSLCGGFNYPYVSDTPSVPLVLSAMTVTNTGAKYVSGSTSSGKFAVTNGAWVKTDTTCIADRVFTDTLGNVYCFGSRTGYYNKLNKYDSAGNLLFSKFFTGTDSNKGIWLNYYLEYPHVSILSSSIQNVPSHLIKFNLLTGAVVSSIPIAKKNILHCARNGNKFYALSGYGIANNLLVLHSFDTTGTILWADSLDSNNQSQLAVNPDRIIYYDSTGIYTTYMRYNYDTSFVVKYSLSGSRLWQYQTGNRTGAVPIPLSAGLFWAYWRSNIAGLKVLLLDKGTGVVISQKKYMAPAVSRVISRSIAKDKYGNLYFAANVYTSRNQWQMLLQKTDAAGNVIWMKSDSGFAVKVLSDTQHDKVFVVGNLGRECCNEDYYLKMWKFDLNGNLEDTARSIYSGYRMSPESLPIVFDKNWDIYTVGHDIGPNGASTLLKISNVDLSVMWSKYNANNNVFADFCVLPSNNIFSGGYCYSPAGTLLYVRNVYGGKYDADKNKWLSVGYINMWNRFSFASSVIDANDSVTQSIVTNITYPLSNPLISNYTMDSSGNVYVLYQTDTFDFKLMKVKSSLDSVLWTVSIPQYDIPHGGYFGNYSTWDAGIKIFNFDIPAAPGLYIENGKNPLVIYSRATHVLNNRFIYDINILLLDSAGNLKATKTIDDPLHLIDFNFDSYFDRTINRLTLTTSSEFENGIIQGINYSLNITDPDFIPSNCHAFYTLYPDTITPHNWWAVNQATGNGWLTYTWYWGDGTSSTGATPSHVYSAAGNYNICLTISDSTGCISTYCDSSTYIYKAESMATVNVVWQIPTVTGTQQSAIANPLLTVYPNPATNQLNINLGGIQAEQVRIYNIDGRLVSHTKQPVNNTIDISSLATGVYIVEIIVGDEVQRVRWVKM